MQSISNKQRKRLDKINKKRINEEKTVAKMIKIYCHGNKHIKKGLCENCQEILDYSSLKIKRCPFMDTKTFCSNCKVNCYNLDMTQKIKRVMRYSGPRMMIYHPILAIKYLITKRKENKKSKRDNK